MLLFNKKKLKYIFHTMHASIKKPLYIAYIFHTQDKMIRRFPEKLQIYINNFVL